MAERAKEIISGTMEQEIENPMILTASSKDEDANNMKKLEDEHRIISDLTGFDNLRAMYEAEALMRRKKRKRKRLRKGKQKIVYHARKEVSVRGSLTISFHFSFSFASIYYLSFLSAVWFLRNCEGKNSKFIEYNMMDSNFAFDLLPFPDEHFFLNFVFVCSFITFCF
jgi:hypothetical protein